MTEPRNGGARRGLLNAAGVGAPAPAAGGAAVAKLGMRLAIAGILALAVPAAAAARETDAGVAALVKADMAELVAGINAHDPVRATAHEADDVISMEAGRPTSVGLANDRQGIGMAFKYNPDWKVRLIEETVDVARSHDMAVYRATYWQDSSAKDGAPLTQKINLIAGFRHPPGKAWEIGWYIVSAMEPSHKK